MATVRRLAEENFHKTLHGLCVGGCVLRVSGTRVTLDTVMAAFRDEATPEEIAQRYPYPSLAPGDIYEVMRLCAAAPGRSVS